MVANLHTAGRAGQHHPACPATIWACYLRPEAVGVPGSRVVQQRSATRPASIRPSQEGFEGGSGWSCEGFEGGSSQSSEGLKDTPFTAKLCSITSLPEHYDEMADCCEAEAPLRYQCFVKHKDDELNMPPMGTIDSDATCTAFKENEQALLETYIYEVARRHPFFYGPELLYSIQEYKGVLTECCEAADKAACLGPKMDALQEKILSSAFIEKFKCSMLQNSEESASIEWFVVRLSQKFPFADFGTVSNLAANFTKVHKECCQSDMLECTDDRADLAKYMCENRAAISTILADCCSKPVLEKFYCLAQMAGDNLVPAQAPQTTDFVDNEDVCTYYKEAKVDFLNKFLHTYSRRYPEFSVSLVLRLAKKYQAILEECCEIHDNHACYTKVLYELQPLVDEPHEYVKKDCETFENLGEYGFQDALLVRYTKKVPQLSTPTLVHLSTKLASMGSKCCILPESQRTACAEDYLSVVLSVFCTAHEQTPVSNKVTLCCTEPFLDRLPCFSALETDETYIPKQFNVATFTLHAFVCARAEPEQQVMKQIALAELLKHKPKATEEQLKTVMEEFSALIQKCCAAADKEACFAEEVGLNEKNKMISKVSFRYCYLT
ncbi:Serum albumin [Myotis brandtii]|uniref:Albumin n=1 Tax=Myotis brandtii TaxID=109478 RepID=S7PQC2_MYOBR|nr:Serum albumin [Myotis brandtii]